MEEKNNNLLNSNRLIEKIFSKNWRLLAVIVLLGSIVYFQTLFFGYVYFDDDKLIIENQNFLTDVNSFISSFKEDVFISNDNLFYRPILTISFIINALIVGDPPFIYHLTNLIIHLIASCLVFILLRKFGYDKKISFFFSLIFTVHPLLSQAIGWIPGRNDSLLALFLLGSLIFYINFLNSSSNRRWVFYLLHLLTFALGLFTKETAFVFIFIILLYTFLIRKARLTFKNITLQLISWLIIMLFWYFLRKAVINSQLTIGLTEIYNSFEYFFPAIFIYLGKIVLPFKLSVYPLLNNADLIIGLISIVVISLLILLTKSRRQRYIIFGFLWFVILILPTIIFPKISTEMTFLEQRLYLPMIGILIILLETDFIKQLLGKKGLILGMTVIIFLSLITIVHSNKFKAGIIFWEAAVKTSSASAAAHINLGNVYYLNNLKEKARNEFYQAINIWPTAPLANFHLGNLYFDDNQFDLAIAYYQKELMFNPTNEEVYFKLGYIYSQIGDNEKAKNYWQQAINLNPYHLEALNNLGFIYIQEKNFTMAEQIYNKILTIEPESYRYNQNLGLLYYQQGNFAKAESIWLKALEINPKLTEIHQNLAILYIQQNNIEKAVWHVQEILEQNGKVQDQLLQILKPYLK